jgi:pseudouridine synthase
MFNKPKGVVTTASDDRGRKTVFDYVKSDKRLFSVGRLDYDSEGLLLLTNDGELTYALTHPKNQIAKHYIVKIEGTIDEGDLAVLRKGVVVDGVRYNRAKVELLSVENGNARLAVTIFEGKNREIRNMFSAVEKNIILLKRVAIEGLRMGGLSRGAWRYLKDDEIDYLKSLIPAASTKPSRGSKL